MDIFFNTPLATRSTEIMFVQTFEEATAGFYTDQ